MATNLHPPAPPRIYILYIISNTVTDTERRKSLANAFFSDKTFYTLNLGFEFDSEFSDVILVIHISFLH